ncbi:5'-methylthioadenosine/S-adenosylhomocysteine nucleosidase [Candidatus Epulonipiscium fishelsonii]|uniref:5'-methylthioadenosine/S-adenosylhomocysteine nucleosidase n=1 Tax=Candidatus Epulonipiscium fishelsonii TaxID=77094 RepID=A0ACC8X801_9FIRM|nr:5'-methylthioadenosine/S-adenosylhomocysteine nucleosidase [Epulopiscium sp. SCG-B11WGA-EpuloA1]ONI41549.1 5'-methylthioadenosine/S-adenosylhomocysteine nucleosidase [Epulopiscium sp. SCG-B05WGA-EpuloA1]
MIGIIGAMEEEVVALKRSMHIKSQFIKAQMEFIEGVLQGKEVVVVKCGIGKVNAAICTQILVDNFNVECIINVGVAGGLHPDLNIGDIVVSSDTVQHDMDATIFGDPRGVIPRMENSFFEADRRLMDIALKATATLGKEYKTYIGRIASGDQFVSSIKMKEDLYSTFTAYCAEMEGAAIAHTCYLNAVPFVIIRAISDKADGSAEVNFADFTEMAARNANKIINYMIQNI